MPEETTNFHGLTKHVTKLHYTDHISKEDIQSEKETTTKKVIIMMKKKKLLGVKGGWIFKYKGGLTGGKYLQ